MLFSTIENINPSKKVYVKFRNNSELYKKLKETSGVMNNKYRLLQHVVRDKFNKRDTLFLSLTQEEAEAHSDCDILQVWADSEEKIFKEFEVMEFNLN